eukprot:TRINITY_DN842_c0_g2_i1.p1 TRINITY_DN842_c0_g2~~TRINITY_DN842_c0_g2_i1.p1  ORF type:complete len:402 (-),score=44.85 TRINITY_DN842_c0_g2_i1:27-1133(-)
MKRFSFQFIVGGFFAVDSFYFLSGFLGTVALVEIIFKKNKVNWPLIYFHRWWRLTPLYFCLIWVWTYITPRLVEGPLTYAATTKEAFGGGSSSCEKYWWSNILYINNMVPWEDNLISQCMPWGWYLANDMQLFVITPLLLWVYRKNKTIFALIVAALLITSYSLVGSIINGGSFKLGSSEWFNLYTKPWTRVGPYLIGVILALLWREKKIIKLSNIFKFIGYAVSGLLLFITVFGPYTNRDDTWTNLENVFYYTFSRSSFILGLAILCYLMLSKNSSFIKTFLSYHFWTPLARLSYGVYLVHPIIMIAAAYSTRHAINWDIWTVTVNFSGYSLLAFVASFVFWIILEKPFASLEREVLTHFTGKKELI